MAVEKGPMSGFRDMLAEQMIARQDMLNSIQEVYESYGFTPLKTPALEMHSTLTGKYGKEGEKLMYKFKDNGGRDVAMRYDQTVPLARVVAQYGNLLPSPYKRYAVGEVWRGDSPQAGRYREFTQFDADIVGTSSFIADAEIIAMMSDSMTALGAESLIRVNNRRILDGVATAAGAKTKEDSIGIISTIDRVDKIGQKEVVSSIADGFGEAAGQVVNTYLSFSGTPLDKLQAINKAFSDSEAVNEGVDNLSQVFAVLEASGYDTNKVIFDQTIARGLDYYTGIIYETTLKGAEELGSVCSGGRFDNLIESLGGPSSPAVGTSIGVDRLYDGLSKLGKLRVAKTSTEVLIANFDQNSASYYMRVASGLRKLGIPAEVYYESARLKKQMKFADTMKIPYVVLMGPDEMSKGVGLIRDLDSGDQIEAEIDEIPNSIKDIRGK